MKKIITILSLLALIGCKTKSAVSNPKENNIVKINLNTIDYDQRNKAYELGKRVLMTCNTSSFKPFTSNEATAKVIKNTTQIRLTKTCLKFRLKYGAFKDIQLVEVLRNNNNRNTIFRYKANYEKKIANKELRVTLNENNKVCAINSKDWIEIYH